MREIPYYINPLQHWMSLEDAEAAIQRAFRTWDEMIPAIEFVYMGRTERLAVSGDGMNVVSWGVTNGNGATAWVRISNGRIYEADVMMLLPYPAYFDAPCEQADNSCHPAEVNFPNDWPHYPPEAPELDPRWPGYFELQDIMTHEVGHVVGLGDLQLDHQVELTMYNAGGPGCPSARVACRNHTTIGYGDILGLRDLYPCECEIPYIYLP